jgi:hypothetical protein
MSIDNDNARNNNTDFEEYLKSDDKIKNFIIFLTLLDKRSKEQET